MLSIVNALHQRLNDLVCERAAVEFLPALSLSEVDYDQEPGMRARVIAWRPHREDDSIIYVTFDYSDFIEHNRRLMVPCYFDRSGKPSLTWEQSVHYPENHVGEETFGVDELAPNRPGLFAPILLGTEVPGPLVALGAAAEALAFALSVTESAGMNAEIVDRLRKAHALAAAALADPCPAARSPVVAGG